MDIIKEIPQNIDKLVNDANCKASWRTRLEALHILKQYDCQKSRDVITRLVLHDRIFEIKEEAFRATQKLNITKNGVQIRLGKKDIGYTQKDFTKVFQRIKRDKKMEEFDINVFKENFMISSPEMYDVMSYEKKDEFDLWIENTYKGLPKK